VAVGSAVGDAGGTKNSQAVLVQTKGRAQRRKRKNFKDGGKGSCKRKNNCFRTIIKNVWGQGRGEHDQGLYPRPRLHPKRSGGRDTLQEGPLNWTIKDRNWTWGGPGKISNHERGKRSIRGEDPEVSNRGKHEGWEGKPRATIRGGSSSSENSP